MVKEGSKKTKCHTRNIATTMLLPVARKSRGTTSTNDGYTHAKQHQLHTYDKRECTTTPLYGCMSKRTPTNEGTVRKVNRMNALRFDVICNASAIIEPWATTHYSLSYISYTDSFTMAVRRGAFCAARQCVFVERSSKGTIFLVHT